MEGDDPAGEIHSETTTDGIDVDIPEAVLGLDHLFTSLAHPRRRYLLYTLKEDTEWTIADIATKIVAWEQDVPTDRVEEDEMMRAYVSLYHVHVPKLVDQGMITFDRDAETIAYGEHTAQALAALEGVGASLDTNHETHARSGSHE